MIQEVDKLKGIIVEGERNGEEIGRLLLYIQTQNLFRDAGYSNFGTFLNHEFSMTIRTAIRYVSKYQLCNLFPGYRDKLLVAPLTACDMMYKLYKRGFKIPLIQILKEPGDIKAKAVAKVYSENKNGHEVRTNRIVLTLGPEEFSEFEHLERDISNAHPDELKSRRDIVMAAMRELGAEAAIMISADQIE
jgi:hypothetical protein